MFQRIRLPNFPSSVHSYSRENEKIIDYQKYLKDLVSEEEGYLKLARLDVQKNAKTAQELQVLFPSFSPETYSLRSNQSPL